MVANDDWVVVHVTFRGTHNGEFQGIPPTGKTMALNGIGMFRIVNGQAAENLGQMDILGLMQQLGAIPS
jgi:predicted ester cyclase